MKVDSSRRCWSRRQSATTPWPCLIFAPFYTTTAAAVEEVTVKRERESRFQNRGAPYNVEMRLYRQRVLFSLYTATSSCCSSSSSNPLFILQVQSSAPCVCGISQGSHSYSKTKEKLTVLKATMHTKHMNGKFCIVTSHCINQSWLKRWRARVPSSYAIITATIFS